MHTLPRTQWNDQALPVGMELNSLMYALRKHRSASNPLSGDLLLDAVTLDDLYEDLGERVMLDAIVIQYAQIKRKMEFMRRALERAATKIKPLGVEISDPFTQRGSTQIACVFNFEDEQSVTIFMHNPDTTPKKIMQRDMLTSWKWLLNKKNITIVVAPEKGLDLNVNEVARRVMKLLEKNSAAFKRANANKVARDGVLQAIKDEVTGLEAQLAHERELLEHATARKAEQAQATPADDGLSDDPSAENYRYKDTGIIEGARKFNVTEQFREAVKNGRMMSSKDIDWEGLEENPRRAKELMVKSNLFGKVSWGDLRDAGMEPGAGFLIDRVYASIQSEPEDNQEARKDYAHGIESVRGRLEACKTAADVRDTLNEMRQELRGVILSAKESEDYQAAIDRAKALSPSDHPVVIEHERLLRIAGNKQAVMNRLKYERGLRPSKDEVKQAEDEYRLASDAVKEFSDAHPELENKKRVLANGLTAFDNDIEFAYRQAREEAYAIDEIAVSRNVNEHPTTRAWMALGERFSRILTGKSESFSGHRVNVASGRVKDWSWADKGGSAPRATKKGATFQLLVADKIERVGGREVKIDSTMALKDAFGFRDVQSGNWVLKDPVSAQFHVQKSAEAITDLADLIGFEPEKFAMKGRLALAFGARGTGNAGGHSAMAHYEPVERVINITKMKGGGSLAHEWFHAFDNMMPEAMGVAGSGVGDFVTANSELSKKLPAEVNAALVNLRRVMTEGEHQVTESRVITPADRRMTEANMRGAEKKREGSIARMILEAGELNAAVRVVDQAEKRDQNQTLARGKKWTRHNSEPWENWRKIAIAHYAKPDQDVVEFKTGELMSMFKLEAMKLDVKRSKDYWSTTLEMAARAFQGYVEDGLAGKKQRNDYLSYGAQNELYDDANPYPDGDERKRINQAFDELFKAMKGTGVLDSVFGLMF